MIDLDILKQAVFESRDGITISDALTVGNPLIFVNPAFERLTGYNAEEALHRNCRYLQNDDRDQLEIAVIRQAVTKGEPCLATIRNYRKDGSLFWNELSISPIYNEHGTVTNFIGIQKDVTSRVLLDQQLRQKKNCSRRTPSSLRSWRPMTVSRVFITGGFLIRSTLSNGVSQCEIKTRWHFF